MKTPPGKLTVTKRTRRVADFTDEELRLFGDWIRSWANVGPEGPEDQRFSASDAWLEADIGDGWRIAFRLVPYAGQPVAAEVRIFPADDWRGREPGTWRADILGMLARHPDGDDEDTSFPTIGQGVTAQVLRRVPFRLLQQHARDFAQHVGQVEGTLTRLTAPHGLDLAVAGFSAAPPPAQRRGGWPDERYAQIAAAYADRIEVGSRSPVADVARRFPTLSPTQVRNAIHTARKRDILTAATKQGRPGGMLTPYGESLLAGRKTGRK